MDRAIIGDRLRANGIPFSAELPERLETYFRLLMEWNEKMDLVAAAEEDELLDRHLTDSLTVLKTGLLEGAKTLIDVGTGAGFPGMALALSCPETRVTLLDSQRKRLDFLAEVQTRTGADNVTLIHARAEDGAGRPELRESFDIAAARAVAPLNVLCEYLLPFVKPGGYALCWKGPAVSDEMEDGAAAARKLGGSVEAPVTLAWEGENHLLVPVRKTETTLPQYPRKNGIPAKRPLKKDK